MPDLLLVLSDPKSRRSVKLSVKDPQSQFFIGLRIGDVVDASSIGIKGKIKITGGSDRSGTPMRPDIVGTSKKSVLLADGPGLRVKEKGFRKRKLVRGNTISPEIYQVNAVLLEGELPQPQQPQEVQTQPQQQAKKKTK